MSNCGDFNQKHTLKVYYVVDEFLLGEIVFSCEWCTTLIHVDRLSFYLTLTGNEVMWGHVP